MIARLGSIVTFMGVLMFVAGCSEKLSTPSIVSNERVELHSETVMGHMPYEEVDEITLVTLAHGYKKYGTGPLELTMTYDPGSNGSIGPTISAALKAVQESLARKGVLNVKTDAIPAAGEPQTLIVSYDAVTAHAPANCGVMPGLEDKTTTRFISDYRLGCGIETMLAKQIARPADLRGTGVVGPTDGRRGAIVVEGYRVGTPNERIEGVERDDLASD